MLRKRLIRNHVKTKSKNEQNYFYYRAREKRYIESMFHLTQRSIFFFSILLLSLICVLKIAKRAE